MRTLEWLSIFSILGAMVAQLIVNRRMVRMLRMLRERVGELEKHK